MNPIALAWMISIPILVFVTCLMIKALMDYNDEMVMIGLIPFLFVAVIFGLVSTTVGFNEKHQIIPPVEVVKAENAKMVVCFYGDLNDLKYKVSNKAAHYNQPESVTVKRSQGMNMWGKKLTPDYELIIGWPNHP
jgi:hypothetical protein